jgi:hypothetical protein
MRKNEKKINKIEKERKKAFGIIKICLFKRKLIQILRDPSKSLTISFRIILDLSHRVE